MIRTKRQKTRATGARYQDWVAKWLEERGWITHNQKTVSKQVKTRDKKTGLLKDIYVSARQDLFGVFDLIAKKDGITLWIQATTHKSLKEKVDKINAANLTYANGEFPMVWMKRDSYNHDIYGFDEVGDIVHPGQPAHYGKIIKRAFFKSEKIKWEF